jgi:hypothetical protein
MEYACVAVFIYTLDHSKIKTDLCFGFGLLEQRGL